VRQFCGRITLMRCGIGYRVRRISDGYPLPIEFATGEVRIAT
jgi:hypothetical protein